MVKKLINNNLEKYYKKIQKAIHLHRLNRVFKIFIIADRAIFW